MKRREIRHHRLPIWRMMWLDSQRPLYLSSSCRRPASSTCAHLDTGSRRRSRPPPSQSLDHWRRPTTSSGPRPSPRPGRRSRPCPRRQRRRCTSATERTYSQTGRHPASQRSRRSYTFWGDGSGRFYGDGEIIRYLVSSTLTSPFVTYLTEKNVLTE